MVTVEKLNGFGADTDEGISRCCGSEALYIKLVNMIPNESNFEVLKDALERNDLDKAFKDYEERQRATEDLIFQNQVVMSAEERNQMFFKTQQRLPYLRRCRMPF